MSTFLLRASLSAATTSRDTSLASMGWYEVGSYGFSALSSPISDSGSLFKNNLMLSTRTPYLECSKNLGGVATGLFCFWIDHCVPSLLVPDGLEEAQYVPYYRPGVGRKVYVVADLVYLVRGRRRLLRVLVPLLRQRLPCLFQRRLDVPRHAVVVQQQVYLLLYLGYRLVVLLVILH